MDKSGEMIRPLTAHELAMHNLNLEGTAMVSYLLRLSSKRPVTEVDLRRTLSGLFK